jgi:tetratricopeptide (TPR) repeat protein
MRRLAATIACLALALAAGAARADDAEKGLKLGVYAYEHGDYAEAIRSLQGVLDPLTLTAEDDVVQARKYLGASLFFTGKRDEAAAELKRLLLLSPDLKLDPFVFPPQLVLFFDEVKASIKDQLDKARAQRLLRDTMRLGERRVELRSLHVNFIPFGAPQFQNGHRAKGWALLGAEAALLALNVASYWAARGRADADGWYPAEADRAAAERWRTAQITALGLFGGAWAYGIADGFYYYRAEAAAPPPGR